MIRRKGALALCVLMATAGMQPVYAAQGGAKTYSAVQAENTLKRLMQKGGGAPITHDVSVNCTISDLNPSNCDKFLAVCAKHGGTATKVETDDYYNCHVPTPSKALGKKKVIAK